MTTTKMTTRLMFPLQADNAEGSDGESLTVTAHVRPSRTTLEGLCAARRRRCEHGAVVEQDSETASGGGCLHRYCPSWACPVHRLSVAAGQRGSEAATRQGLRAFKQDPALLDLLLLVDAVAHLCPCAPCSTCPCPAPKQERVGRTSAAYGRCVGASSSFDGMTGERILAERVAEGNRWAVQSSCRRGRRGSRSLFLSLSFAVCGGRL